MENLVETVEKKHKQLLALMPKFTKDLENNLYQWFRVALTYTSNAIEGNTLTHVETAQIIEKDITVEGKSLTEHLEAINHAQAVDFAKKLSQIKTRKDLEVSDILEMHKFILQRINDNEAGKFRHVPVRIMGSNLPVPNYIKIPSLMDDLISWLHNSKDSSIKIAADSHLKLAYIHPFVDGNGRTARLLMNLILLQETYPLVYIKAEDRLKYIKAIQKALNFVSANFTSEDFIKNSSSLEIKEFEDFYKIIFESIEYSLDEYIKAVSE
jgi:Fic family protein